MEASQLMSIGVNEFAGEASQTTRRSEQIGQRRAVQDR